MLTDYAYAHAAELSDADLDAYAAEALRVAMLTDADGYADLDEDMRDALTDLAQSSDPDDWALLDTLLDALAEDADVSVLILA